MNINILAFIFGCILILIGIIGGGLELKELKIPKVSWVSRIIAILVGIVFISLGFGLLTSQISPPKPLDDIDSNYEKNIIGTWKSHQIMTEGVVLDSTTSYASSGHFRSNGIVRSQLQNVALEVSGTWYIRDGDLYSTIESSNQPVLMPVGFSSTDKIVNITDNELTFKSGEIITRVARYD